MPHNRFFSNTPFFVDAVIHLEGEEAHHLQRVLRKKKGDLVALVNGKNQCANAKILVIEKKAIRLQILHLEERRPVNFSTILCQAIPRLNRLDIIVEKGTELGMTDLWLFPGELSEKKELAPPQLKRLESISIAAMKQCGRLDLPKISIKPPLLTWEQHQYPAYFGEVNTVAPPFLTLFKKRSDILFFIGPESGFSEREEEHLRYLNTQGVNLHPHTLRAETASLVALTLIASLDK